MNKWEWLLHSILLRETVFEGFIVNIEPLRIGFGEMQPPGAPVDLALLRIRYNDIDTPYIPGSSLKGVFRNYATLLARNSGLDVCTGLSKETCGEVKIVNVNGKELKLNNYIKSLIRNGSKDAIRVFYENTCLMCKIFGSAGYMSNVSFSDAYPIDESGQITNIRTSVRPGITIDRRSGASQQKFDVEFIEPGAKFKFNIYCRNLPNYAIGMLSLVLKRVNKGLIKIGGFKSRGFGTVKIEGLRFRSRDFMKEPGLTMSSLEPDVDIEVDLTGVAKLEDGWITSEGEYSWKALDRLIEVWRRFVSKS